jgi:predicted RNA binding protein YcfA (HicA-like mRNA interferase family)
MITVQGADVLEVCGCWVILSVSLCQLLRMLGGVCASGGSHDQLNAQQRTATVVPQRPMMMYRELIAGCIRPACM